MTGNKRHRVVLQERDRHLLRELSVMRLIDREQAKVVAGFRSTTRANARLLLLGRAGYLRQSFHGTITGGRKAVYSLTAAGAGSVGVPPPRIQRGPGAAAAVFLEHQLLVNETYLVVKYRPIPIPGVRLHRWITPNEPLSKSARIVPDGYLELDSPTGIHPMFVEIDRGTEPLKVWTQKYKAYLQFAISGEFGQRFAHPRFRVLILSHSERHNRNLRRTAARLTPKIFWFATFEYLNPDAFWSPVWQRPIGDGMHPLL